MQYIVLNIGMLNLNSSVLPLSKGYISQYTPYGICGLIFYEVNELIISLMIIRLVGLILGISPRLCLREIPRSSPASPRKTLSIPPLLLGLTHYTALYWNIGLLHSNLILSTAKKNIDLISLYRLI